MTTKTETPYFMETIGTDEEFVEAVLVGCRHDGQRARCSTVQEGTDWLKRHFGLIHNHEGSSAIDQLADDPSDPANGIRALLLQGIAEGLHSTAKLGVYAEIKRTSADRYLNQLKDSGLIFDNKNSPQMRWWLTEDVNIITA